MKNFLTSKTFVRNFIFGVEDSLVSTVGLLSGVAIADVSKSTIFLTGMVLIFVEALSMGAGSYLSEHSAEEYEKKEAQPVGESVAGGIVMFCSYFIAGFIPLVPYIVLETNIAFGISIGVSIAALFVLGALSSKFSGISFLRGAVRMMVVGGAAIGIGVLVGSIISGV